uniref:Uncharacterized protein n=1 Tax=Cyprinodon variegatus TaxID=28743 RepID=A0A3Q2DKL7_CYPVA
MSVNASQLDLTQLIYRHLKEHGFISAAEELHRHSPQVNTVHTFTKHTHCRIGYKIAAFQFTKIKKTEKTVKNPASPKKTVAAKRKTTEKSSQGYVKAKKSKLNASEKAAAEGNGSDSDSSLDVEKWKKLLDQLTEVDIAKMETINALASPKPQPKKARVRKPRAKPVPKAEPPVQQTGETKGQMEKDEKEIATQTPRKENMEKKKGHKEEHAAHVATPSTVTHSKKVKNVVEGQVSSTLPAEKQRPLDEILVPEGKKTDEEAPEPKRKKKKKKEKEGNEDKTDGKLDETNCDKKDEEMKPKNAGETTELETKILTEEGKNSNKSENVSQLVLQKKKLKKKEKEKSTRDENVDQIDKKSKKKEYDGNLELEAEEINQSTNTAGSDTRSEQEVQDKKAKKKKEKKHKEGNVEHAPPAEERNVELNVEEKDNLEQITKKKKEKRKTANVTELHENKEKKQKGDDNEGNLDKVDEDLKAETEKNLDTSEIQSDKESEQNVQRKKKKKKKERTDLERNEEHVTVPEEENNEQKVEENRNSEQIGEKKKAKKRKDSLGSREIPEEGVGEQKNKKKKADKEHSQQTVQEEKTEDEVGLTDNKSTSETGEQSLETTSHPKKKKSKSVASWNHGCLKFF